MSKEQFRLFLAERLTAAALEIFAAVEKTCDEYQDEICRFKEENGRLQRLLDNVHLNIENVPQCSLPEAQHIKEELVLWTNQKKEQFQELNSDLTESQFSSPSGTNNCDQQNSSEVSVSYNSLSENRGDPTTVTTEVKAELLEDHEVPVTFSHSPSALAPDCSTSQSVEEEEDSVRLLPELIARKPEKTQKSFSRVEKPNVPIEDLQYRKKPWNVASCSENYNTGPKLQINAKTRSRLLPNQCYKCGKLCKNKYSLNGHMRIHTEYFIQQSILKNHIRSHTGGKPFQCLECGKAFSRKCSLNDHLRIHTGQKPFQCQECGKSFGRRGSLKDHLRTHRS